MNKREVLLKIQERLDSGLRISKVFVDQLSGSLHKHCNKQPDYWACLYKILKPESGLCKECSSTVPGFINMRQGFKRFCSQACGVANSDSKRKRVGTNLQRYGVDNPSKAKSVIAKIARTHANNGGHPLTRPKLKKKHKATMQARYGVDFAAQNNEIYAKVKATCEKRYGVSTVLIQPGIQEHSRALFKKNNKAIREKMESTCLRRYGVKYLQQDRGFFEKHQLKGFKLKHFTLSGKPFSVRGYEPQAIKWLHNELNINVNNIQHKNAEGLPSIKYGDKVYHPDLRVKIKNRWYIVEVKSTYTCGLEPRSSLFTITQKKLRAVRTAGYAPMLLIVEAKGKVHMIKDPDRLSKAEIVGRVKDQVTHRLPR